MFLFNRRDTLNGSKVFLGFNSRIQNNCEYVLSTITFFFQKLLFSLYAFVKLNNCLSGKFEFYKVDNDIQIFFPFLVKSHLKPLTLKLVLLLQ